ncbi:polyphenol oxidase family protein [bacterium]|nr:polyphenol oxidase family protein [bacterium]
MGRSSSTTKTRRLLSAIAGYSQGQRDDETGAAACFREREGSLHFDLWAANRAQLREAGLRDGAIVTAGLCSLCRNDLFFSYRREGAAAGRYAAVIGTVRSGQVAG